MIEREETQKRQSVRTCDANRHVYNMIVAYIFRYLWGYKKYELEDE